MRPKGLFGQLMIGTLLASVAFACAVDAPSERLCTPNAYVFCRCQDRAKGTKLCRADGKSFDACKVSASDGCSGGESAETEGRVVPEDGSGGKAPGSPAAESDAPKQASVCGNGTLEDGELCDDGNKTSGDGCTGDCRTLEQLGRESFTCPGQSLPLVAGRSTVKGRLDAGGRDPAFQPFRSSACMKLGLKVAALADTAVVRLRFTPQASGTARVSASSSSFLPLLAVAKECGPIEAITQCASAALSIRVTAGEAITLLVGATSAPPPTLSSFSLSINL